MTTKIAPIAILGHRFNPEFPTTPAALHDCINPALERAAALADLMEAAFESKKENEIKYLWRAAQAIRFEVLDAQAILNAYVDSENSNHKAAA